MANQKHLFGNLLIGLYGLLNACDSLAEPTKQEVWQQHAQYHQKLAQYFEKKAQGQTTTPPEQPDTSQTEQLLPDAIKENDKTFTFEKSHQIPKPWDGSKLSAGGSINQGDTNTKSINLASVIKYHPTTPWTNLLEANYDYTTADQADNLKNRLQALARTNYDFNDHNGVFVTLEYLRDLNASNRYTMTQTLGYSRLIFETKKAHLTARIGPSLTQRIRNTPERTFTNEFGTQASANYEWQLSSSILFTQNAQINDTPEETRTSATSSVEFDLNDDLAIDAQYMIEHTNDPLDDKPATNTQTTFSVVYHFG